MPTEFFCQMDDPTIAGENWVACDKGTACLETTYAFMPDKDAEGYLDNWVEQIDLYCISKSESGLIGSMFFVGTFTGSFILPRASDIYGRKPLFLIGLTIFFGVVSAAYFVTNLYVLYFIIFMGGISETGKYYVAYVYAIEFMPEKSQSNTGLWIFNVFGFATVYIALQFWFITNKCVINSYIAQVLCVISFIITLCFLPESPRFLYSQKKYKEARDVIVKIAKMNKKDVGCFTFKMEEE